MINLSVSVISQFKHAPIQHLETANHVLNYLKGNPCKGILFKKSENRDIEGYVDANWAGLMEYRKSTTGYYTRLWGNLATWRSKKQSIVAKSSAEVEYRAITQRLCELIWIERLLRDLNIPRTNPMKLYSDRKSTINTVHNPIQLTG